MSVLMTLCVFPVLSPFCAPPRPPLLHSTQPMTEAPHHRPVPDNHLAQLHAAGLLGIPSPLHLLVTPFGRKRTKRKEEKKKRTKKKKKKKKGKKKKKKKKRLSRSGAARAASSVGCFFCLSHLVASHGCQSKVQNQNPDDTDNMSGRPKFSMFPSCSSP
ncbi:hypothetical protein LZ32DRAFT_420028 [Colletotrichum eremochloae]|nr:hypothetical protein LZ32DRAFT_420028 [Colletotrichum eremochloae]